MGKFKENRREKAGVIRDMSIREKVIGAALVASAVPLVYFPMKAGSAQYAGIRKSVTTEAEDKVAGFDHVVSGGEIPVPIFRSTNTATLALEDGSTCIVEYKTGGGSLKTLFGPDNATLADFGTCPPKDQ